MVSQHDPPEMKQKNYPGLLVDEGAHDFLQGAQQVFLPLKISKTGEMHRGRTMSRSA